MNSSYSRGDPFQLQKSITDWVLNLLCLDFDGVAITYRSSSSALCIFVFILFVLCVVLVIMELLLCFSLVQVFPGDLCILNLMLK